MPPVPVSSVGSVLCTVTHLPPCSHTSQASLSGLDSFPAWELHLGHLQLSAHSWTRCFSLQSQTSTPELKTVLSLPCKDCSDLYINDVVINQSDRLLGRSAHVNNWWYLSNIPAWSGFQNELFSFTLPVWTPWRNSLKSKLFPFGFVTVRCYCFIPGEKLVLQTCFSFLSILPLGHCLFLQGISFNNIIKLIIRARVSINPFNEVFILQIVS